MDPYAVLGASRGDNTRTLRQRYRRRSLLLHPDKGGDPAAFQALADAFELLSHPARRQRYDEDGGACGVGATRDNGYDDAAEDADDIAEFTSMRTCGYYALLLTVSLVMAVSSIAVLLGRAPFADRVRMAATTTAMCALAPLFAWLVSYCGTWQQWDTTPWAQLIAAQLAGTAAGVLTAGLLYAFSLSISALATGLRGSSLVNEFPHRDGGSLLCFLVLCVRQDAPDDTSGAQAAKV